MRAFERPVCGGVVTGLAFGLGSYVSLKDKNRTIMGGLYTFDDSNKHILHTIVAGMGFFSAMLLGTTLKLISATISHTPPLSITN
tara:strand:+ start:182 stop:436 length:255 start_codon:yes stop_codon:yes gene_type:complete